MSLSRRRWHKTLKTKSKCIEHTPWVLSLDDMKILQTANQMFTYSIHYIRGRKPFLTKDSFLKYFFVNAFFQKSHSKKKNIILFNKHDFPQQKTINNKLWYLMNCAEQCTVLTYIDCFYVTTHQCGHFVIFHFWAVFIAFKKSTEKSLIGYNAWQ